MAKLTVIITHTGKEFEFEDIDLKQYTPCQLINELIKIEALPIEMHNPYRIWNKKGVIVAYEDMHLTFDQLGFCDGDIIKIIMRSSGCGAEIAESEQSKKDKYLTFLPKIKRKQSKQKSNNQEASSPNVLAGGRFAGVACGAIAVFGGLCCCPIGAAVGVVPSIEGPWSHSQEWIDEDGKPYLKREAVLYDVYSSIFAPGEVKCKSHMLVQVYLHLYEETEKVKALAQESDKNAERRGYIPLQCKLKRGDKVDVQLNIYGERLLMSDKKIVVWQGSFTKCSFDYYVPNDIDENELSCVALLTVNDIPVGEMRFITRIEESPRQLNPEIIAHKYNKVFISYSHQDESKVKFLHKGLVIGGVPHFFDRSYLKPGDIFPKVIRDYINSADLFVLCWSENAAQSEYVKKERIQALTRAYPKKRNGKLLIYPMSIEPRAELPSDMKDNYHFIEI